MNPNPMRLLRLVLVGTAALSLAGLWPRRGFAQWVFLGSEPTICTTPFKPVSGLTFHAGGQWRVIWSTIPGQFGSATFTGTPNPVLSEDGTMMWENPTAFVKCWILWYQNGYQREANYDWHVESYGGTVKYCSSGGGPGGTPFQPSGSLYSVSSTLYDPYAPDDPEVAGSCSTTPPGTGSSGGGSGSTCHQEYVYIDISYDNGATWSTWWEGWATVCDQ